MAAVVNPSSRVSLDDMAWWHQNGWISYDVARVDDLNETQLAEIFFVRDIARSGLSDAVTTWMLSEAYLRYIFVSKRSNLSFA
jgi:hypothetical protein